MSENTGMFQQPDDTYTHVPDGPPKLAGRDFYTPAMRIQRLPIPVADEVLPPGPGWADAGTISGDNPHTPEYTDTANFGTIPDSPWILSGPFTVRIEVKFIYINHDVVTWLVGRTPWNWVGRPKMKRRAARRIAGYTRTGRRR
ncbi:hypothetical protein [Gordonia sp. SND2]|uniref:hypothetical protein n=1 Tax=Gordonia sp. SND2 TaxID=3388659 RepID=UPI00398B642B